MQFTDLLTNTPCTTIPPVHAASTAGLDVFVPENGYAVLHFSGGTQDFVFKGGKNYKVKVSNAAKTFTSEHFQYFHKVMGQQPNSKLIPVGSTATVAGNVFAGGKPFCMIGWFGKAIYRLLTKHLDR